MAATDTQAIIEEVLGAVFSVRSVPRLQSEGQLPLEVRVGARVQLQKNSGREPQGAWLQDELIGCKLPVVK
jgi:hypothetical protein